MAQERVRLAIIGTGGVANAHAKAHLRNPDLVEIVALADIVEGKAAEFAARHGLAGAALCGHYEEVLALADVDAVDVCLRPEGHGPASLASLGAGKHVFCEKPMATSVAEAGQMRNAAESSGLVHMVDFSYRYYPGARFIRQLVDEGQLGEILRVRVEYLRDSVSPPLVARPGAARRRPDPTQPAANIIGDLGSHIIDLARFFAGEISRVSCQYRVIGEYNESAMITVDFADGAVGSLETTSLATGRGGNYRRVEVHGTRGAAFFWFGRPSIVELYMVEGATRYTRGPVNVAVPGVAYTEDDYEAWIQGLVNASRMFAQAIQTGGKVKADFHDGYMANLIMEAAFESSRSGEVVNLGAMGS